MNHFKNMGGVMTTPIVDFVKEYAASGTSRFHMPGHKGQPFVGCEPLDITEVAGADALYEASGIIAESEANATALFGSRHTFYSTEGSSLCIRAMIFLAVQAWKKRCAENEGRPVIIAARNAHKAFLYACALTDADVHWLYPQDSSADPSAGNCPGCSAGPAQPSSLCSCPITPAQAEEAILEVQARTGSLPAALYVTSPDYLGGRQDLASLSRLCHRYRVPFLVDNAHGAYLKFLQDPCHPMDLGASMCCDSAHKTLPVLTGGAYLHVGKEFPLEDLSAVRQALTLFGSTSPSYLILQSLDHCNAKLSADWPAALASVIQKADQIKEQLRILGYAVAQTEPLKLTLLTSRPELAGSACAPPYSGDDLADALRSYGIECEHSDSESLIFMFTPENTDADFTRLLLALTSLAPDVLREEPALADISLPSASADQTCPSSSAAIPLAPQKAPVSSLTIREAVFSPSRVLAPEDALGCICAAPVVSCPPAIPIAVSGEIITEHTIRLFRHYGIETVRVVL